jgi:hypothetical protein
MHYLAAKEALYEKMSQAGAAAGPGAANPAGAGSPSPMPSAGPSAPPAGGPPPGPAMKSAKDSEIEAKLAKFETDFDKLKSENTLLHRAVEVLSAPVRKSITGTTFVAKPGSEPMKKSVATLSEAEITGILKKKAMDATLSKKDRELMVDYRLGSGDVKSIAHLLSDAK